MPTINIPIAHTASETDQLLEAFQLELASTKNSHRIALQSLGLERSGWITNPYSEEAFRIWDEHLRNHRDDFETIHHLAIMHHARAIDLEMGPKPREADKDWQRAFDLWTQLWNNKEFLQSLAKKACRGADAKAVNTAYEQLQDILPKRLLRLHFDLAFDKITRKKQSHRSDYHLKFAQSMTFPPEHINAITHEIYTECIRAVPDAAWRSEEHNPEVLKEAEDVIFDFLTLVPDCLPALEDAVRLQVRMLNAWYTDFQAVGTTNQARRQALLTTFRSTSDRWRPIFERLIPLRDKTDESVRHGLCHWYRITADIRIALAMRAEAEPLYELGILIGIKDDNETIRCARSLGENRAAIAREQARIEAPNALASCNLANSTPELSLLGHLFLAQAYEHLNALPQSLAVCSRGLAKEFDAIDLTDIADAEDTKQRLQELLDNIKIKPHLDNAQDHMQHARFDQAIDELNQALKICPKSAPALFSRCQCFIAKGQAYAAREDLVAFIDLAQAENSQPALEAAQILERDQLKPLEESVKKFGSDALSYRKQAVECFNNDQFAEAVRLLRLAASCVKKAGLQEINTELAMALNAQANQIVQYTMTRKERKPSDHLLSMQNAYQILQEASRLDRNNKAVKENLDAVLKLIEQLQAANKMLQQYGSERVVELQQQAVQAWNDDCHSEAIELLRKALNESKRALGGSGSASLGAELSKMLTLDAVRRVNQLSESSGSYTSKQVLKTAAALLVEALTLDPSNSGAQDNLQAIVKITNMIN